jgi:hypothetical protein
MEAITRLANTLKNQLVLLEYRRMLINHVIIPMTLYSSEIFGMNEIRMNPVRRIADSGIYMILNSKKFCRVRAYQELDIKPVQTRAASARARAISNWEESSGLICELIDSIDEFKF